METSQHLASSVFDLHGRGFARVLEATMAVAAACGAVLLGPSQIPGAGSGEFQAVRLIFVFSVILAGLMVHRWTIEDRIRGDAEAVRRAAEDQLNRTKDQFIANVSHGLRTPLTGIVGFSHVLRESITTPEDRESVNMILAEAAELSRIVDDLLMAARLDAELLEIQTKDVPLAVQVEEVMAFMELMGVNVAVDCEPAAVRVDPERFRQVLRNLLVNAHRHGRPQVALKGQVRHGRYICHVIDQGSGVSDEDQSRLFRRFAHQPSGQVSGYVGLGLSIVQELCHRMDAQVSYRRIRGETHFVLSLPLASQTNQGADVDAEADRRLIRIPERIVRVRDRLVRVPA